MKLYMGLPEIEIPQAKTGSEKIKQIDENNYYYTVFCNKFKAFSVDIGEEKFNSVPCAYDFTKREELLQKVTDRVLNSSCVFPEIVADCSSASLASGPAQTYKLVKMSKLSKSVPLTFTGAGGCEFIQALQLIRYMQFSNIIMLASQVVVPPDSRQITEAEYHLGDAVASVIVTSNRELGKFEIISMNTLQFDETIDYNKVKMELRKSLAEDNLTEEDIGWTIIHNYNDLCVKEVSNIVPKVTILQRDLYKNINFGTADFLVTMNMCEKQIKNKGIIWSIGRYKTLSYLIISRL